MTKNNFPALAHFWVWCPDLGEGEDQGNVVRAPNPEEAALLWAKWHDSLEAFEIAQGTRYSLHVQGIDKSVTTFEVSGSFVPVYRAEMAETVEWRTL